MDCKITAMLRPTLHCTSRAIKTCHFVPDCISSNSWTICTLSVGYQWKQELRFYNLLTYWLDDIINASENELHKFRENTRGIKWQCTINCRFFFSRILVRDSVFCCGCIGTSFDDVSLCESNWCREMVTELLHCSWRRTRWSWRISWSRNKRHSSIDCGNAWTSLRPRNVN